ncbi:hypothetical protein chiPu_0024446 [Chiloscyllium punctatum]|uniref:Uncharacterized protein n=1 Tax=Chiloscyllium punctatum TaxID=137246 RepID=A0A401TCE6_CHIPU|nr:hypothetical protein [Chiloscyllium punctatum]
MAELWPDPHIPGLIKPSRSPMLNGTTDPASTAVTNLLLQLLTPFAPRHGKSRRGPVAIAADSIGWTFRGRLGQAEDLRESTAQSFLFKPQIQELATADEP